MLNKLSLYYIKDINLTHHSSDTLASNITLDHKSINNITFQCGDLKLGNIETTGWKHPLITAAGTAALGSNQHTNSKIFYVLNVSKLASNIDSTKIYPSAAIAIAKCEISLIDSCKQNNGVNFMPSMLHTLLSVHTDALPLSRWVSIGSLVSLFL